MCWRVHVRSTHQMKKTATESQRERNALTCFNEKVQINIIKMETFSFHPPACLPLILAIVTNTNLTNFMLTVHISYMASVFR